MGIHGHAHSVKPPRVENHHPRIAHASDAAANSVETYAAGRPDRRSGATTASSRNAAAGSRTVASAMDPGSLIALSPQDVEMVGDGRPPHPEDQDDERQPEGHL